MTEGWKGEDYFVMFSADEVEAVPERCLNAALLPGYRIGLRGWDDFILQDENGATFTFPTVPCDANKLARFLVPEGDELVLIAASLAKSSCT